MQVAELCDTASYRARTRPFSRCEEAVAILHSSILNYAVPQGIWEWAPSVRRALP